MNRTQTLIAAAVAGALTLASAHAQDKTPGFNTKIPEQILTPDTVQTSIGTLKFVDGVPTPETTKTVFDHLDFARGMEVFLNFIPAASIEAIRLGQAELGAVKSNQAVIWDQTGGLQSALSHNELGHRVHAGRPRSGNGRPTVVEVPPGMGPTTVNDAFFRFVVDMGPPGPDSGQGWQVPHRSRVVQRRGAEGREGRRPVLRRALTIDDQRLRPARVPR